MTRLEALKEAEALVERASKTTPPPRPARQHERGIPPVKPSLGDRISQILRVADYLVKEEGE